MTNQTLVELLNTIEDAARQTRAIHMDKGRVDCLKLRNLRPVLDAAIAECDRINRSPE